MGWFASPFPWCSTLIPSHPPAPPGRKAPCEPVPDPWQNHTHTYPEIYFLLFFLLLDLLQYLPSVNPKIHFFFCLLSVSSSVHSSVLAFYVPGVPLFCLLLPCFCLLTYFGRSVLYCCGRVILSFRQVYGCMKMWNRETMKHHLLANITCIVVYHIIAIYIFTYLQIYLSVCLSHISKSMNVYTYVSNIISPFEYFGIWGHSSHYGCLPAHLKNPKTVSPAYLYPHIIQ